MKPLKMVALVVVAMLVFGVSVSLAGEVEGSDPTNELKLLALQLKDAVDKVVPYSKAFDEFLEKFNDSQ